MGVGPSLRQRHAHHAIHEGGYTGAVNKTDDVIIALQQGEIEQANMLLDDLLDYWQTRIIAHADAEETGFYQEFVDRDPDMQDTITKLVRDHDLMRMIVADIHQLRKAEAGISEEIVRKLQALIVINDIHSREEERELF